MRNCTLFKDPSKENFFNALHRAVLGEGCMIINNNPETMDAAASSPPSGLLEAMKELGNWQEERLSFCPGENGFYHVKSRDGYYFIVEPEEVAEFYVAYSKTIRGMLNKPVTSFGLCIVALDLARELKEKPEFSNITVSFCHLKNWSHCFLRIDIGVQSYFYDPWYLILVRQSVAATQLSRLDTHMRKVRRAFPAIITHTEKLYGADMNAAVQNEETDFEYYVLCSTDSKQENGALLADPSRFLCNVM